MKKAKSHGEEIISWRKAASAWRRERKMKIMAASAKNGSSSVSAWRRMVNEIESSAKTSGWRHGGQWRIGRRLAKMAFNIERRHHAKAAAEKKAAEIRKRKEAINKRQHMAATNRKHGGVRRKRDIVAAAKRRK